MLVLVWASGGALIRSPQSAVRSPQFAVLPLPIVLKLPKNHVHRSRLTVVTAPEVIAVACEPFVEAIGDDADEGDLEDPRKQAPFGQHVEQLLDRGGPRPGSPARTDQLNCFHVRTRRDPGKARHHARL